MADIVQADLSLHVVHIIPLFSLRYSITLVLLYEESHGQCLRTLSMTLNTKSTLYKMYLTYIHHDSAPLFVTVRKIFSCSPDKSFGLNLSSGSLPFLIQQCATLSSYDTHETCASIQDLIHIVYVLSCLNQNVNRYYFIKHLIYQTLHTDIAILWF